MFYHLDDSTETKSHCLAEQLKLFPDAFENYGQLDQLAVLMIVETANRLLNENTAVRHSIVKEYNIDAALINRYNLGYVDKKTIDYLCDHSALKFVDTNRLSEIGLMYGRTANCINRLIVPFPGKQNSYGGMTFEWSHASMPGKPMVHCFNAENVCLFNQETLKFNDEVILNSDASDVLYLKTCGVHNGIATMGMRKLNPVQLDQLSDNNIKTVILAFPESEQSQQIMEEITSQLSNKGIKCKHISFSSIKEIFNRGNEWMHHKTLIEAYNAAVKTDDELQADTYRYKKWLYDFELIYPVIDFVKYELMPRKKKIDLTIWDPAVEYFVYWLAHHNESLHNIKASILDDYQLHLFRDAKNNSGKKISVYTQVKRFEIAYEITNDLLAHGIISFEYDKPARQH